MSFLVTEKQTNMQIEVCLFFCHRDVWKQYCPRYLGLLRNTA